MGRRNSYDPTHIWVAEVDRLKAELREARYLVLHVMRKDIRTLLDGYRACGSTREATRWESDTVDGIIALAEILPPRSMHHFGGHEFRPDGDRAYCPLCRRGASTAFDMDVEGFVVPWGLHRHLTGSGGTIERRCQVMSTALALARDHWDGRLGASDEAEAAEEASWLAERRRTERLYRIGPDREPVLLDEGWRHGEWRDEEGLAWAEHRLEEIGFRATLEGNVVWYTDDRGGQVAYADPRRRGRIMVTVFREPTAGEKRGKKTRWTDLVSFHLLDRWQHDLRAKYEARLPGSSRA